MRQDNKNPGGVSDNPHTHHDLWRVPPANEYKIENAIIPACPISRMSREATGTKSRVQQLNNQIVPISDLSRFSTTKCEGQSSQAPADIERDPDEADQGLDLTISSDASIRWSPKLPRSGQLSGCVVGTHSRKIWTCIWDHSAAMLRRVQHPVLLGYGSTLRAPFGPPLSRSPDKAPRRCAGGSPLRGCHSSSAG